MGELLKSLLDPDQIPVRLGSGRGSSADPHTSGSVIHKRATVTCEVMNQRFKQVGTFLCLSLFTHFAARTGHQFILLAYEML